MRKMLFRLVRTAAALLLPLVLLSACSERTSSSDGLPALRETYFKIVPSDWMGLISDDTPISRLTIPGTHDTGTYTSHAIDGAGFVKTQNMSISEQLKAGVRFLDIRGRLYRDSIVIHHEDFYLHLNLTDVINDCRAFLKDHPSETILMSLKDEYDHYLPSLTYYHAFLRYHDRDPDLWYLGNSIPLLGDVRGKIVLLRRFGLDPNGEGFIGIWLHMSDTPQVFNRDPRQTLYTEDLYSPGGYFDQGVDEKKRAIRNNITAAQRDSSPDSLYLSFTSATQWKSLSSPLDFANKINPWLMNTLVTNHGPMGIVPMDFVHEKLIFFLINSNFRNSGGYWIVNQEGGINTYGDAGYHGHGVGGDNEAVDLGIKPSGHGYWILSRNGGIHTYGDAGYHGHGVGHDNAAVSLGVTPSGNGYWILSRNGGIHTYGDAKYHGHGVGHDGDAVALGVTPSGKGYWILSRNGGIHTYGDAGYHGHGVGGDNEAVDLGVTPSGNGYWILSRNGGIHTYGDARYHGHGVGGNGQAVSIGVTPSGQGYWILSQNGKISYYGDARFYGEHDGSATAVALGVRK
ncbi:phosphatidylinositol-specific phospholipase C [Geobacter sp. DSM 9736]|uniref:phosphatidylinositol-specific phospholipase C n=1 Tax=Geobacter sp. DSM 9736 TaxID=1277350 RepID=UPI000B614547|nr:phosphatidylinositol-specific phospholipase C [Geobacter sp. DSM 9736]SNB46286.1 Phosphatidylinositol-specific phospholipase C, X domain [Geobacter sp. DSM 9736]